jgi:hypothetical protein
MEVCVMTLDVEGDMQLSSAAFPHVLQANAIRHALA